MKRILDKVNHSVVPLKLEESLWPYFGRHPFVTMIGSPYGHYPSAETGTLISIYETRVRYGFIYGKILLGATAAGGYSGSPIIAPDGKVIGMATFMYPTAVYGGLNSFLILKFLDKYL